MILQSHAEFRCNHRAIRETFRFRIGTAMLGSVVTLLGLLNLLAGAA